MAFLTFWAWQKGYLFVCAAMRYPFNLIALKFCVEFICERANGGGVDSKQWQQAPHPQWKWKFPFNGSFILSSLIRAKNFAIQTMCCMCVCACSTHCVHIVAHHKIESAVKL